MNQQLIKEIETKITKIQEQITSWKQIIKQHENTLLALIEELAKIKQQINEKNMKNNKRSPRGSNNSK